jgi:hypothetical protein
VIEENCVEEGDDGDYVAEEGEKDYVEEGEKVDYGEEEEEGLEGRESGDDTLITILQDGSECFSLSKSTINKYVSSPHPLSFLVFLFVCFLTLKIQVPIFFSCNNAVKQI